MKTQRETLQVKYFNYLILEALHQACDVINGDCMHYNGNVHGDTSRCVPKQKGELMSIVGYLWKTGIVYR